MLDPRSRARVLLAAAPLLVAAACAEAPAEAPRRTVLAGAGAAPASGGGGGLASDAHCLEDRRVGAYLETVRDAVCARWRAPDDLRGDGEALLRFRVAATGRLAWVEVVRTNDVALADSAVAALHEASPFEPMPATLTCLGREQLMAHFLPPGPGGGGFCPEGGRR